MQNTDIESIQPLPPLPPRMPLFEFRQPDGTLCKLYADSRHHEGLQDHMMPLWSGASVLYAVVVRQMHAQGVKPELCEWLHRALIGHGGWTPYSAET